MYNLRYHIASLVAVFLALALGLILGGIVVERGALDAQRAALVESLRQDFRRLSNENKALQDRLGLETDFADRTGAAISTGLLADRRVMLLANQGASAGVQSSRRAVEQAGGTVDVALVLKPGFGLNEDAVRTALESAVATGTAIDAKSVAAALAAEWTSDLASRPVTDALVKAEALRLEGLPAGSRTDGIVTLATADDAPDAGALTLAEEFQNLDRPAVGAQVIGAKVNVAAAASELGLGGVNAVDTSAGRWSLVELLAGGQPALYGVGPDVDAAYPPIPPITVEGTATTR